MAKAKYGDTVVVHCKAKLSRSAAVNAPTRGRNLKFTLGGGYAIEDIEKTVVGMAPGESRITTLSGEKLFGQYREDNIIEIDRDNIDNSGLEVGRHIRIPGHTFSARVLDISESKVTADMNHPLSQRDMIFSIRLVEIV